MGVLCLESERRGEGFEKFVRKMKCNAKIGDLRQKNSPKKIHSSPLFRALLSFTLYWTIQFNFEMHVCSEIKNKSFESKVVTKRVRLKILAGF